MGVGPGDEPPRTAITVRVHALPDQPGAKRSATSHGPSCAALPSVLPRRPQPLPRAQGLSARKRRSTPSHQRPIAPPAPGRPARPPRPLPTGAGRSEPLRSPPPPSRDHVPAGQPTDAHVGSQHEGLLDLTPSAATFPLHREP